LGNIVLAQRRKGAQRRKENLTRGRLCAFATSRERSSRTGFVAGYSAARRNFAEQSGLKKQSKAACLLCLLPADLEVVSLSVAEIFHAIRKPAASTASLGHVVC